MDRRISASRTAALLGDAVHRSPAYLAIAEALKLLVTDGRIPTGTRLPSERELTEVLGVSRTTVTRAYAVLKDQGYLLARQGAGSVVQLPRSAHPTTDRLLSPGLSAADHVDLSCAAPTAPTGIAAAYAAAVEELPRYLGETGYYPSGLPALREAIARRYDERGLPTHPDQILVTSGALSGLAIATRALLGPGTRALTESPSYPNAIATLLESGARVAGADIDQSGWAAGSLTETLSQVRPQAAYLLPDFQNPTGLLMTDEQRAEVARALTRSRTVPIVDETLVELAIDDVDLPLPFGAHHRDTVTLGSASKTFWGGLRLGWIRASESMVPRLVSARLSLDLGAPVLEQLALVHLMETRESILAVHRDQLRESRSALVSALAQHLPSWRFRVPAGGQTLWCELPQPVSTRLAVAAHDHGVILAPGPAFAPEGGLERFLRLPFSRTPAELTEAVERLARVWESGLSGQPRKGSQRTLVA